MLKVKLYAKHIGKSTEQIEADIRRPKYFSPSEAVEYGIIDKVLLLEGVLYFLLAFMHYYTVFFQYILQVLYNERGAEDRGVVSDLKKAQLI